MFDLPATPSLPGSLEVSGRPPVRPRTWEATLTLRFERAADRTVLAQAHHRGPLRVQKPLYPDGNAYVDMLILHPPAGIAGGDRLSIGVRLDRDAHARITTPGAAKWYRTRGPDAQQFVHLDVADHATLEWLPQEAIVFDGALVRTETDVVCTENARACGWDIWMLGRAAAGEHFRNGCVRQRLRVRRDGTLLWSERVRQAADDPLRQSPMGWQGASVMGSFWALGLPNDESLIARCREVEQSGVSIGVTRMDNGLLLVRALGLSCERVRRALTVIWSLLRPALCGVPGTAPRIWAT